MSNVIEITSISRNGQHAICNWICKQLTNQQTIFENHVFVVDRNKKIGKTNTIKYNQENKQVGLTVKLFENYFDKIENKIILLRDPYNWLASLLHSCKRTEKTLKEYIKKYIDLHDNIKSCKFFINYNKWFDDINYRKEICSNLNLSFTDNGLGDVVMFGNGSSFDLRKMDGNGDKMKVLERWKFVIENNSPNITKDEFIAILKSNNEINCIAEKTFNMKKITQ